MKYLLYNPLSGGANNAREAAEAFTVVETDATRLVNVTEIHSYKDFLEMLEPNDSIYVFGGDGTLSRFVNEAGDDISNHPIYYYPCGTGNDFASDVLKSSAHEPFPIDQYITELPIATVNGESRKFINGVGFGVDGYCCEVGDILRKQGKSVNYVSIAISGVLGNFKPRGAVVTVDGIRMDFKRVWIAPTMFGSRYGGGMIPTPDQRRSAEEKRVSIMVFHGCGRLKTLMILPSIFKGTHVKHKRNVTVISGKEVSVKFDAPTALQIDGETITNITEYSVRI